MITMTENTIENIVHCTDVQKLSFIALLGKIQRRNEGSIVELIQTSNSIDCFISKKLDERSTSYLNIQLDGDTFNSYS